MEVNYKEVCEDVGERVKNLRGSCTHQLGGVFDIMGTLVFYATAVKEYLDYASGSDPTNLEFAIVYGVLGTIFLAKLVSDIKEDRRLLKIQDNLQNPENYKTK